MSPTSINYQDAELYRDSARIPLSIVVSRRARRQIYQLFNNIFSPSPATKIVDVGVSDENSSTQTNMLERLYPWPSSLTCLGIQEGVGFKSAFPLHNYVKILPGAPLPYSDQSFDIAYSNAVIEHVGSEAKQREFIAELQRIAKRVFIVAPNRAFPIEHHTGLPLLHWLPAPTFRRLISKTNLEFWSREENLNAVSRSSLAALFPAHRRPTVRHAGIGFSIFKSNLVAFT